jgi:putative solute:sodium symporter small subunit
MPLAERARRRWRAGQRVTAWLLAIWFGVTFGVTYFARELSASVFGWPFSFWVAAQGALLVYLVLVCVYARLMHRFDLEYGVAGED